MGRVLFNTRKGFKQTWNSRYIDLTLSLIMILAQQFFLQMKFNIFELLRSALARPPAPSCETMLSLPFPLSLEKEKHLKSVTLFSSLPHCVGEPGASQGWKLVIVQEYRDKCE